MLKYFYCFFLLIILSACTAFPSQSNIERFATASSSAANIVNQAYVDHIRLKRDLNIQDNALLYLTDGDGIKLAPEVKFIGDSDVNNDEFLALNRKRWETRLNAIDAIVEYSDAIIAYANPDDINEFQNNASRISSAIASLATVAGLPQAALITPFSNFAAGTIGFITAQGRAVQLRQAMRLGHEPLEASADLLKSDLSILVSLVEDDVKILEIFTIDNLRVVSSDKKVTNIEKLRLFEEKTEELDRRKAQLAFLKSYGRVLDRMISAHLALSESKDEARALNDFLAAVNLITDGFRLSEQVRS